MNQLIPVQQSNVEAYRASTDAAGMCREIVMATAKNIQGRRYVAVEGWEAIAIAHGCAASAMDVERVNDEGMSGFKCVGIVRRMSDGAEIARGEGFLGDDETMWAKRPVYARRAMTQTRAISRACRSAFAHVVVLIDKNLSTTPAEEVPAGGFDDAPRNQESIQNGEYTEVREGPAPREKLEGKHPSKSQLQAALRRLGSEVGKCTSGKALDDLLSEYESDIAQAKRYLPKWIDGDPANDSRGLQALIVDRRRLLDLISDMKASDTRKSLGVWVGQHGDIIDELTDGNRRIFEKEYQDFESGLLAVEQSTS